MITKNNICEATCSLFPQGLFSYKKKGLLKGQSPLLSHALVVKIFQTLTPQEREAFLAQYHKRSNVESTFFKVKAKFGEALRSKSQVAQFNEALLKVLC